MNEEEQRLWMRVVASRSRHGALTSDEAMAFADHVVEGFRKRRQAESPRVLFLLQGIEVALECLRNKHYAAAVQQLVMLKKGS